MSVIQLNSETTNQTINQLANAQERPMGNPVVSVDNLVRRFGEKNAINNVSFTIEEGRVFGLVGENGAGKTTLIKHLLGLLAPQAGAVSVLGCNPVDEPERVLNDVGYLSEDRNMPDWMTVTQFLHYNQAFYRGWDEKYADELREMFDLPTSQKIKSLSRGQRARVGLIAALAHKPKLLVLDEPSSGLDSLVRSDILAAIIRTVADEGRTVLFSSHLPDEVERVADQVAMLHQGELILNDELESVLSNHHVVVLDFPEPRQVPPEMSGGFGWRGNARSWSCIVKGEPGTFQREVDAIGATVVDDRRPALEDVFVAQARS